MRILQVFVLFALLLWKGSTGTINTLTQHNTWTAPLCKELEESSPLLRLKRYLFCEYSRGARPSPTHQTVTNVSVSLVPIFIDFDEYVNTMAIHSWMPMTWNDFHLIWNPSDFEGITTLHVKSDELWTPDFAVYNSGDLSLDQSNLPLTSCLVYNSGLVTCVPSVKHVVKCETDFKLWPYDKHKCGIHFGSWSHTGEEVNFNLDGKGYAMDSYVNNTQWMFSLDNGYKVLKKFKCCPNDTYPIIIYDFTVKRHPGLMHSIFITPAIALSLLTLTVLWLDSRSTERIAAGCVDLICHLLCIFDLHWQLPHNGTNPPNILLFYRDSLALATFALILTPLLRKLHNMNIQVPYWISSTTTFVLSNRAGRFLILTSKDAKMSDARILANENEENSDVDKSGIRLKESSWRDFAAIIEWLSFFSVLFVYIIVLSILVPSA